MQNRNIHKKRETIVEKKQPIRDIRIEAIKREFSRLEHTPGSKVDKLKLAFIRTIEAGYWRPGDRIPTETELVQALLASLGTVQSALRRLVSAGIIKRLRGSGSWIADINEKEESVWFLRFFENNSEEIIDVSAKPIEIVETEEQGPWSSFLHQGSSYIKIYRIFSIGEEFTVVGKLYLTSGRFRPLLDYNPSTFKNLHVHHVLQDRFNAPTLSIEQNCRLIKLDENEASILDVAPGSIGLEREIFSHTFHHDPLSYQTFTIPPNKYRMNVWSKSAHREYV